MKGNKTDGKLGLGGKVLAAFTLPQLGVLFIAPWAFIIPAAQLYQNMEAELPMLTQWMISFRALPFMLGFPLMAMWCAGVFGFGPLEHKRKLRTRLLFGSFLGVQLVFSVMMLALLLPLQPL